MRTPKIQEKSRSPFQLFQMVIGMLCGLGFLGGLISCSSSAPKPTSEWIVIEQLEPGVEVEQQPFLATNPMHGPGLHVNGIGLQGEAGPLLLMISAYEESREIFLTFLTPPSGPPFKSCPADKGETGFQISLAGVGDLSQSVVSMEENHWMTSFPLEAYSRLKRLDFTICGSAYPWPPKYQSRLEAHARLARQRAETADIQARESSVQECKTGNSQSCLTAADMLWQGVGGDVQFEAAMTIYRRECEAGNARACLGAAKALRSSHQPASGAENHYRNAATFARKACEIKGKTEGLSCLEAAMLHAHGFGMPPEPGLVERFAASSCERGFKYTCGLRQDLIGCSQGKAAPCAALARMEDAKSNRDPNLVSLWRLAACRNGDPASCP